MGLSEIGYVLPVFYYNKQSFVIIQMYRIDMVDLFCALRLFTIALIKHLRHVMQSSKVKTNIEIRMINIL